MIFGITVLFILNSLELDECDQCPFQLFITDTDLWRSGCQMGMNHNDNNEG